MRIYLDTFYKQVNEHHEPNKHVIVSDELVENFYEEVQKFTSASDLFWSVWDLVQAQNSSLDLNFVKYAVIRFKRYFESKKHLVD